MAKGVDCSLSGLPSVLWALPCRVGSRVNKRHRQATLRRPDGQITSDNRKCVNSSRQKYLSSVLPKYMFVWAYPSSPRGRFAIVTNVEGGMRWTAGCSARMARGRRHPDGRRSRVVLVPRRWDQDVWCRSTRRRRLTSPALRGAHV